MSADVDARDEPIQRKDGPGYRPEIQGLRTIAAILIALHHVWFNRVSGGVDVFFVVSGFLITGSLTRELAGTGRLRVGAYLTRIARRLFPAAWAVLAVAGLGTVAFVSKVYWESHFADLRSAVLYAANFRFAETSVDYLAQDTPKSPVQHFWAMSIQGQFYLAWPIVLGLGWLAARALRRRPMAGVTAVLVVVAATSFAHSVASTPDDPAAMYFDSFARVWEFAVGGLLALAVGRISVRRSLGELLGAAGLVMLILTGVVTGGFDFPGWVALVPVTAAVSMILAGNSDRPGLATAILRWRPLVVAGDYSYAFFLWHWPILILWLAHDGSLRASVPEGIVVLLAAAAMSWVSVRFIEAPFQRRRSGPRTAPLAREWALVAAILPALLLGTLRIERATFDDVSVAPVTTLAPEPGVPPRPTPPKASDSLFDPAAPIVPDPLVARKDLPMSREDDCIEPRKPPRNIEPCIYGTPGGPSIALVGGSHAIQWTDALDALGKRHGWEIRLVARAGCRFGRTELKACNEWADKAMDHLLSDPPDAVFTTGTTARAQKGTADDGGEMLPDGYVRQWRILETAGIPVVLIRDNPEFDDPPPACVDANRSDPSACAVPRADVLSAVNPLDAAELPTNVVHFDLTDHWCTPTSCLAVIDNTLVYRDRHHLTRTFVLSLVPALERELLPILARLTGS